jgi:SAM-dependent methyltransferase
MKLKQHPIIDLGTWLEQPAGSYIRAWEESIFDQLTVDIFGFNALQIGLPEIHSLAANRMPNRWLSTTYFPTESQVGKTMPIVVTLDFAELPFESQSIDLIVLPHVLEFASEPHQILREVERVLIPEGRVIISGFNRTSLWGARQTVQRLTRSYYLPKEGEFISMLRLKDWLKLLNMEVGKTEFGCYAPPFSTDKWLHRAGLMEWMGQRYWPYLGAVYVVQAIKRVKGMRLIGPSWKASPSVAVSSIPVTHRGNHQAKK